MGVVGGDRRRGATPSRAPILLTVVLVLTPLAGCISDDPPVPTGDRDRPDPGAPVLVLRDTVTGCRDMGVYAFVDVGYARSLVPEPFTPTDAAAAVGAPAQPPALSGQAVVAGTVIRCDHGGIEGGPVGIGEVVVAVDDPGIEGAQRSEETDAAHSYALAWYVDGPATANVLRGAGWPVIEATIANAGLDGRTPSGRVSDTAATDVFQLGAIAGPPTAADAQTIYEWSRAGDELLYWRITTNQPAFGQAKPTTCLTRSGSAYHELFGSNDCSSPTATGWAVTGLDVELELYRAAAPGGPGDA